MSEGYIYVMSSSTMAQDIFKVGFTEKTPPERLKEANGSTWALPNFKLEFAKKVNDAKDKEQKIHRALSSFGKRIHPKREFFLVPLKSIRILFDMIDGEMWKESLDVTTTHNVSETKDNNIITEGPLSGFYYKT